MAAHLHGITPSYIMAVMKITPVPVTPFRQNCSLLQCTASGAGALVDPGGDVDTILGEIDAAGVRIEKIFLTHGHVDHAAGTATLAAHFGVPIEGPHIDDRFLIERIPENAARYGFGEFGSFEPSRWLSDGDTVSFGDTVLDVLHCPGHTPGHVVFFHELSQYCIVGDVIFAGSVGRTDMSYGNHDALVRAIRDKLFPLGDDVTFMPGHGQTSTFGWERKCNPYVADLMFDD